MPPPPPGGPPAYDPGSGPPYLTSAPRPGVIPLRPLRLGDMFEGAMGTIRGNPAATLGLALIVGAIFAVPALALIVGIGSIPTAQPDVTTLLALASGQLIRALWYFGEIVLTGMVIVVLSEAVLGRRIGISRTWQTVRPRVLPLIGLSLLLGAAAAVAVIAVALLVVLAYAASGGGAAVLAGVLLGPALLVFLVFFSTRLTLASPALVLERVGPIAAIRRSWGLTRGQFWRTLGIVLLTGLIVAVIGAVIGAVAGIGTGALVTTAGGGDGTLATSGATQVVGILVGALLSTFQSGVVGLLYLDQRIRKEGLDVTLIAASGTGPGAPR